MYLPTMTREELELAILENDIVDVMLITDDVTTEELRTLVHEWIVASDECSN